MRVVIDTTAIYGDWELDAGPRLILEPGTAPCA